MLFFYFTFWKKVLYHPNDESFPENKDGISHFLGISENSINALTIHILTEDENIISRCVVHANQSAENLELHVKQEDKSKKTVRTIEDILRIPELPKVDLLEFIWTTFVHQDKSGPIKATIVESLEYDKFKSI